MITGKNIMTLLVMTMAGVASAAPTLVKATLPAGSEGVTTELTVHNGVTVTLQPDASGILSATVDIDSPVYGTLYRDNAPTQLWLTPGEEVSVTFTEGADEATFGGKHADVNRYLNHTPYRFAAIGDTWRDEADFLHFADSLDASNHQKLDATQLDSRFKAQESGRIIYENALAMSFYPEFHPRLKPDSTYTPSETFYTRLKELTRYDGSLLASRQYTDYIVNSLGLLSRHELPDAKGFDRFTLYLDSCVRDPQVKEYLFDRYARANLTRRGPEAAREYIEAYPRYVTDSSMRGRFDRLYAEINSLAPGQPSPQFDCERPDGSRSTLADYAGKWVYIDIWATWCGPCRREIPHLKKLEEKYKDAPIEFVSISTDNDRDAWVQLVTGGNMQGVQLRFDGHDKFMESYKVTGIPRFILIDPEGRIVNADMTRPSDPATVQTLDGLLR